MTRKYKNILDGFYDFFAEHNKTIINSINTREDFNELISNNSMQEFINNLKKQYLLIIGDIIADFEVYFQYEYIEFKYALLYIQSELAPIIDGISFENGFTIKENNYYKTLSLFAFIHSLINKVVYLHYIESENEEFKTIIEKTEIFENIIDIEKQILKASFDSDKHKISDQNENKHRMIHKVLKWSNHQVIFFQIHDPVYWDTRKFNLYPFIFVSIFLFLWYLDELAAIKSDNYILFI